MSQRKDVSAKARWDNEGGSQIDAALKNLPVDELEERDRPILACLGASVLSFEKDLPKDARQRFLTPKWPGVLRQGRAEEHIAKLTGEAKSGTEHHET